jgi:hypothetical protein
VKNLNPVRMGGDNACTSCSSWRHRLGGLEHAQVVAGRLIGWGHRLSDGAVSRSGAPVCVIFCISLILSGETYALLGELFGRGSEC